MKNKNCDKFCNLMQSIFKYAIEEELFRSAKNKQINYIILNNRIAAGSSKISYDFGPAFSSWEKEEEQPQIKEFSCSNCSKPNDVGVKKCWWCEVNFNE